MLTIITYLSTTQKNKENGCSVYNGLTYNRLNAEKLFNTAIAKL
jgi:cytoplasmic iron level regulating protein YaaA (DUF328/UPF0246 family)